MISSETILRFLIDWWWLITAILIFLLVVRYVLRGLITASNLSTYVIVTELGIKKILEPGHYFIWQPGQFILKRPKLTIESIDPSDPMGEPRVSHLLNPSTGRISLNIQTFSSPDFEVTTRDNKSLTVRTELSFRLVRQRLGFTLQYENFGQALRSRLHEAFRDTIGAISDENVGGAKKEIREKIIKFLEETEKEPFDAEPETVDNEKPRLPLGIKVIDVTVHFPELGKEVSTATESIKPNEEIKVRHMEDINYISIDKLRDQFLIKLDETDKNPFFTDKTEALKHYQEANQIMLRILELQAEQNIARCLVGSGSLMVVSTDELGMKGNLLREPMRKVMSKFMKDDDK